MVKIDPRQSRAYTLAVLELVDEGVLDQRQLIRDLLCWMSEQDVFEFCDRNLRDLFDDEEESEND